MSIHITNKEMGKYIAGIFSGERSRIINDHISACAECSKLYDTLSRLQAPDLTVIPSAALRKRVLDSYDRAGFAKPAGHPREIKRFFIPAFAAAALVLLIAVPLLYYKFNFPADEKIMFSVLKHDAASSSDHSEIKSLTATSEIFAETSDYSLSIKNVCEIKILPGSRITILKAGKKNQRLNFSFKITSGKIISNFYHGARADYEYITPHAVISSSGTEIFMSVNEKSTEVMLKSGTAVIHSSVSNESLPAQPGSRFIVSDEIVKSRADDADFANFASGAENSDSPKDSASLESRADKQPMLKNNNPPEKKGSAVKDKQILKVKKTGSAQRSKELREEKREIKNNRDELRDNRRRGKKSRGD